MERAYIKENREDMIAMELGLRGGYHLDIFCGLKQTEKAIYAMFFTGYTGTTAHRRCKWVPKAWIGNAEHINLIPDYDTAVAAFQAEYDQ